MSPVKIVLSVDALSPAMSGIGRYTWELVQRLGAQDDGVRLRCYRAGRWVGDPASLLRAPVAPAASSAPKRTRLRAPRLLQRLYWRQTFKTSVFHAPNYFLPPAVDGGVITVHDLSVLRFPQMHPQERVRQFDAQFRGSLARAAHLITDSQTVRDEIVDLLAWPADRVTAVHLAASPGFAPQPAAALRAPLAAFGLVPGGYTLSVATIEPRKRIDALLAAYRMLPEALRNASPLVLVGGPGWRSEGLLEDIARAQREGWLRYLRFVCDADLRALYAGASLFAWLSIYEGFGLPMVEAMASGVPVMAANRSCMPEVLNGAGLLVDPDDTQAVAAQLERALGDIPWRAAARARGLAVAAGYSWDRCAAQTLDVYRRVAARRG